MKKIVYVKIKTTPDNRVRQAFDLSWPDNNVGVKCNENGFRGQCFYSNLEYHLEHFRKKGYEVIYGP